MQSFRTDFRFLALVALTLVAVLVGAVNLREQGRYRLADDGVFWVESSEGLVARAVTDGGAAAEAGLRVGDLLRSVNGKQVRTAGELSREVFALGAGEQGSYRVLRGTADLEIPVVLTAQETAGGVRGWLRAVGVLYLLLGLFVLLRRFSAPRAAHFYLFCLASFVLFVFSYTGELDTLDWAVYWSSVAAMLLQPALYAHFCLAFPRAAQAHGAGEENEAVRRRGFLLPWIYGPAALLGMAHLAVALGWLRFSAPLVEIRWRLDRLEMGYLAAMFLLGTALLAAGWRSAPSALARKQTAWVLGGSLLAGVPFTAFYAAPYLLGVTPGPWMTLSALFLVFLPLAFCYAIGRYRLLDVEIVLERSAAYALATAALVGLYLGVAALAGDYFLSRFPAVGTAGLVAAVVATGLLFRPLQRLIQAQLDKVLFPRKYDYRQALLSFGRELSSQTDRDRMVASLLEQLAQTLHVTRAAVLVPSQDEGTSYAVAGALGGDSAAGQSGDFGFLEPLGGAESAESSRSSTPSSGRKAPGTPPDRLFFAGWGPQTPGLEQPSRQETAARLELHYYFACRTRNRTVAILGLGKTAGGEFLSAEDAALVETLAGYLAVAIENVALIASLKAKAAEYERLKEFSENIVESINVGLLAVDLEDRVDAFNTPLRMMLPALAPGARGRTLAEVLPPDLVAEFERLRDDGGIHNLYQYRLGDGAGQDRIVNIAIAPLLSQNCDLIGRLVIFDDVTDRVELEAQLAQAEKLSSVGLMAAGVAHEVNTPLTVISTQAQMLAKQLPAGEKTTKILDKIISQTFRASEIVNSLLNFSRTKGAAFEPLEINKVIAETLLLLDHQFKEGKVTVESRLEPALPAVSGNSGKLQQVFLNLFLNARDAMAEGGRLRVTTAAEDSVVRIEIADTGAGIRSEHLNRIYDPFFTTKLSGRGTGLGLAVTYGIVREHSGRIQAESLPGLGTRFRLEFPVLRKAVHA